MTSGCSTALMRGNAAKSPEACFAAVERPRWEQRAQKMWPDCGWTAGQPVLLRLLPLQHPEGKGRCLCVLVGGRVLSLSLSQTPWENSNSGMYFPTPGVRWGCSKAGGGGGKQAGPNRVSLPSPPPQGPSGADPSAPPGGSSGLCGKGEESCASEDREIWGEHRPTTAEAMPWLSRDTCAPVTRPLA